MMKTRSPVLAADFLEQLLGNAPQASCLKAANTARDLLLSEDFQDCPSWREVWDGVRPEQIFVREPGEFNHGWQFFAAAHRDKYFRDSAILPDVSPASAALLRSQSGFCSGAHLTCMPCDPIRSFAPHHLRVVLQRRLRLPLPLDSRWCKCGGLVDSLEDHRASCATVGRLIRRAGPLERVWARVCREAGARVLQHTFLRDLNLEGISDDDGRHIEVIAAGLPGVGGAQIALDATLVSPVQANGLPRPRAAFNDGVALQTARELKNSKYPELMRSRRCRLVVTAMEIGGRWSEEAWLFLALLAEAKARSSPPLLRRSIVSCLMRRWSGMIAVAAQSAFAASLLGESTGQTVPHDDWPPPLGELLCDREVSAAG